MKTASTEREAIVAYLRREAGVWKRYSEHSMAAALERAADEVTRGDHIKDQDHGRA